MPLTTRHIPRRQFYIETRKSVGGPSGIGTAVKQTNLVQRRNALGLCVALVVVFQLAPTAISGGGWPSGSLALNGPNSHELSGPGFSVPSTGRAAAAPLSGVGVQLGTAVESLAATALVPVVANTSGQVTYSGIEEQVAYNPSALAFVGVINESASAAVDFTFTEPVAGLALVRGTGTLSLVWDSTIVNELLFRSQVDRPILTSVTLVYVQLGAEASSIESKVNVTISEGWNSVGPKAIGGNATNSGGSGQVTAMAQSPSNPDVLYAAGGIAGATQSPAWVFGSAGGVFRSTDDGGNWSPENNGLGGQPVNALAVNATDPLEIVALTSDVGGVSGGAIYKTVNGGDSWQQTYPTGGSWARLLNGTLYAATFHGLLTSHDFGSTWTSVASFPGVVTTAQVAASGADWWVGVFLANQTVVLERSTNEGRAFVPTGFFPGYESASEIQQSPTSPQTLWSLVYDGYTPAPNLFVSSDGGASWAALNDSAVNITVPVVLGTIYQSPQALAIDSVNGSTIWVAGPGYLYESTNGGAHFYWATAGPLYNGPAGGDNRLLYISPVSNRTVFLGSDEGVERSADGGTTWVALNNRSNNMLYAVAASGRNIYTVAQDWSPLYSNDAGASWQQAGYGNEEGWAQLDPYDSSVLIFASSITAANPPVVVSLDGGTTVFSSSFASPGAQNSFKPPEGVAFVNDTNNTMFLISQEGVWKSDNSGKTFTLLAGSPTNGTAVATDPGHPGTVYVSKAFGATYRSTDWGKTWIDWSPNTFWDLAVDPSNSSILAGVAFSYTTATYSYSTVELSYDSGRNFSLPPSPINMTEFFYTPPTVTFTSTAPGPPSLIATGGQGIWATQNLGDSWTNLDANLPVTDVSNLCLEPNGSAYASTWGSGVWFTTGLLSPPSLPEAPVLIGWLPSNASVLVNGTPVASRAGFFESPLSNGTLDIEVRGSVPTRTALLSAVPDGAYYLNVSAATTTTRVRAANLPSSQDWSVGVNGTVYTLGAKGGLLPVPLGPSVVQPLNASGLYTIWGGQGQIRLDSSLFPSSLSVPYAGVQDSFVANVSSQVNISPQAAAYADGDLLWVGGGGLTVLNASSLATVPGPPAGLPSPVAIQAVTNYSGGFLLAGGWSGRGAVLYSYNPVDQTLTNLTAELPAGWFSETGLELSTVQVTANGSIAIAGGAQSAVWVGELTPGHRFLNWSSVIPSDFEPYFPYFPDNAVLSVYVPSWNGLIVAVDGYKIPNVATAVGALNLSNGEFTDWSYDFLPALGQIGQIPQSATSYGPAAEGRYYDLSESGFATDGSAVMVVGITGSGAPYEALWTAGGIEDLSDLFPANLVFTQAGWNGNVFILAGASLTNLTSPVWAFDPSTGVASPVALSGLPGAGLAEALATPSPNESAIATMWISQQGIYAVEHFCTFVIRSQPVGTVAGTVSPGNATVLWGGTPEQVVNGTISIPTFNRTGSLLVESPGYQSVDLKVNVTPFQTTSLSIRLLPNGRYPVVFTEAGLPTGTNWSVTFSGQALSTTSGSISFVAGNGTYPYAVGIVAGFTSTPSSGNVSVNGASTSVAINFRTGSTYTVTFVEAGLPAGTMWSIAFNGSSSQNAAAGAPIAFSVSNGTFSFTVGAISGYTSNLTSGSVRVHGGPETVNVQFSASSSSHTFLGLPSWEGYGLIGVMALIVVLGIVFGALRGRRKTAGSPPTGTTAPEGTSPQSASPPPGKP